jgi:probable rRNA maturation factor
VPVVVAMRGRRSPMLARHLGRTATRLLDTLRLEGAELSLVLVSDEVMHTLNHRWRGKDRTTDVLAFPQEDDVHEGVAGPGRAARTSSTLPERLLGDVVISVDTARKQAEERGHTIGTEAERLLVHGVLHLIGYDHERSPAEARRMQRKERALLRALGA